MQTSLLISSGEFARMCNVSRELLIHYDKIGLLKPKEVRENGYRYYSLQAALPLRRHQVFLRYGHVHEGDQAVSGQPDDASCS